VLFRSLLALRSYGSTEHLPKPNKIDNKKTEKLCEGYRFLLPGYNMRPTEITGAVGLVQLEKLPAILAARRSNAELLQHLLKDVPEVQLQRPVGDSSWLSFALLLKEVPSGKREAVVEELTKQGIECRPIVGGNITAQPVMSHLNHAIHGTLPQAKKIDKQGFSVANSHEDLSEHLHHLKQSLMNCLTKDKVMALTP
jgi:CDP-4-dehydro-6-deoxyglucose reductase, E1